MKSRRHFNRPRSHKTLARFNPQLESLEPRQLLVGDLVITEFMASNESTLADENGDYSDWIELFNTGADTVDLDGWYLTDDAADLTGWKFRGGELASGESLVVFASGKDRDNPLGELHTDFRLSRSGEYLAIVEPNGRVVSNDFNFPAQLDDISYGLGQALTESTLVAPTANAKYLVPSSAGEGLANGVWTATTFDDASWTNANAAIGYDTTASDGDFASLFESNIDGMQNNGSSVYLRSSFNLGTVPDYNSLKLDVNYDDGFAAYLNGTKIADRNAPANPVWNSTATAEHGGISGSVGFGNFSDGDDRNQINLLGDAQFDGGRLRITPAATDQTGAAWIKDTINFGADYSFSASMQLDVHSPDGTTDADGRGGEGMTFVIQSGGETRLGGAGGKLGLEDAGMTFVAIELDSQQRGAFDAEENLKPSHLGINTSAAGSVAKVTVPRFNGHPIFSGDPGPGVEPEFLWVDYDGATKTLDVFLADANVKPESPTLSTELDLNTLFGGVNDLWVGWTAATSSAINAHDVVDFTLTAGAGQLGLETTTIDITDFTDRLVPGENVLAVHGLNLAAGDDDFLFRPKIFGSSVELSQPGFFSEATPGVANGETGDPPSGSVVFSDSSRAFTSNFSLTLTAPSDAAEIRYTTNGDIPTETSTLYTGAISINSSERIRARAFEPGKAPGAIQSHSFVKLSSNLSNFEDGHAFESNIPIMVFESWGRDVHGQDVSMVPVSGLFFEPGEDGVANILDEPSLAARAGMRIRGQTSQGFAKKSYALEFWTEDNSDRSTIRANRAADREVELFGLPAESDWVLHGPYSDKTQLNNFLTFKWSNRIGLYAPKTRLIEAFVNRNGGSLSNSDYVGTYVLMEKIKRDNNRLDIAELTPSDKSEPEITGGYIWKKDKPGAGDRPFRTSRGQELRMVEPGDSDITATQKSWLNDHINDFERALYGSNFTDPDVGYAAFIDVDSWIDTWLLVETTKNIDGFRLSTYYHKDRGGKIEQGPAWDYNLSLGNANYLRGAFPDGWYGDSIDSNAYPYWDRLFEDPNFAQKVADRWQELRQGPWSTERMLADIDEAVNVLSNGNSRLANPRASEPSNPISRNYDRWNVLGTYLWPNCFFGQGSCPSSPVGRPNDYGDYINIMRDFVEKRTAWIDTQFPAGPMFSPEPGMVDAGSQVTLTAPEGQQVFYTVDGTDPLAPIVSGNQVKVLESNANAQVIVPSNSTLIGRCSGTVLSTPDRCFVNPSYELGNNGETWQTGRTGIGYDEANDYDPLIRTDVDAAMNDVNTSIYIRIPFDVTQQQIDNATDMTLGVRYDDGFVAYLWSDSANLPVEIARANAPGSARPLPIFPLAYNAEGSADHPDGAAVDFVNFPTNGVNFLKPGTNYLVVQGLNGDLGSSDFLFDAEISLASNTIDPNATTIAYDGPITVDGNTLITARSFDSGADRWSGISSDVFIVEQPNLAITEINYNPYSPTSAELAAKPDSANDDFEFIEIQNLSDRAIGLAGTQLTNGVQFEFPAVDLGPGDFAVIVDQREAFELRYGTDINILGEFKGNLSNSGESITLTDAAGATIVSMEYRDDSLWPTRADGIGATLQLRSTETPKDQYSKHYHWTGSTEFGGSPGAAGAAPFGIVINEVLAHTDPPLTESDSIELLNTSNTPIDISGWYLSDAASIPAKFRIPNGSIVAPGEYLVFNESDFNPTPLNPASNHFALSGAKGDDVWLTQVIDGQITTFADDVHFRATLNGESLGRIPNGTGRLTPNQQRTLGSPNSAARVGSPLISELNYHPGPPSVNAIVLNPEMTRDDLEFVEIFNPLGVSVDLTNWRIRGGVDYDFDAGQVIPANSTLVVTPFNPTKPENAIRTSAFRAHYGIGVDVTLIGGYSNKLHDGSERVELQSPDEPPLEDPNLIPSVTEDEVIYDDVAPWPTAADGGNRSLHRTSASAFGHAAASWSAKTPSPGSVDLTSNGVLGDLNGDSLVSETDINLLAAALRTGNNDTAFDINNDSQVNDADRDFLIRNILGTDYGDSNLDGQFNSTDLIQIFQRNEYEDAIAGNSTWGDGDWNGDGDFESGDLVTAFQAGSYTANAVSRADAAAAIDSLFAEDSAKKTSRITR